MNATDFTPVTSSSVASSSSFGLASVGGYIDDAVIRSRVKFRYDYAEGVDQGHRAEFLMPFAGVLGGRATVPQGPLKWQVLRTSVEWAVTDEFALTADFPIQFTDNANATDPLRVPGNSSGNNGDHQRGAGDFTFGMKWALLARPDEYLTAQVRAFVPTGDPARCLGTGHSAIEAGLLYRKQYESGNSIFAEVLDWQGIDNLDLNLNNPGFNAAHAANQDFNGARPTGNVLRFGVGTGVNLWDSCFHGKRSSVTAVCEVVGWTVLDGLSFVRTGAGPFDLRIVDATGDTIVNGKYGVRWDHGKNSVYAGYGHNWTSDKWYSEIVRIDLSHYF